MYGITYNVQHELAEFAHNVVEEHAVAVVDSDVQKLYENKVSIGVCYYEVNRRFMYR